MKNVIPAIAIAVSMLLSACGSNYNANGTRGSVLAGRTVAIKATSNDADKGIRNAIGTELFKRGLQASDNPSANGLILSYYDDWKWDITMYLWALDLKLTDNSGKTLAVADFSHFGLHHYPNNREVVKTLFEKWDAEGVFRK